MIFAALGQTKFGVEAIIPNEFHIIPVLDLTLDEWVLDLEERSERSCLVTNHEFF